MKIGTTAMINKKKLVLGVAITTLFSLNIWYNYELNQVEKELSFKLNMAQAEIAKCESEILRYQTNESDEPEIIIVERYGNPEVLGFRNNNPGNIKGRNWYGQIGVDDYGHAIFSSEVYGIRALTKTLVRYEERGINTIEKIVSTYAEGNNKNYIRFLCKYLKVKPDEKLNIRHKLHELVPAIITFECGSNPYPFEYFVLLSWHSDL